MSENPTPTPEEMRVRQFEAELASRERLTTTAEKEIGRVWEAYARITKLSAAFLIIVAGVLTFLGFKTYSDIKEAAQKAAESEVDKVRREVKAELDRQFVKDEIRNLITEKAKERIDITAGPLVEALVRSSVSSWIAMFGDDLKRIAVHEPQPARHKFDVGDSLCDGLNIQRRKRGTSQVLPPG